jgi:hypothetical protein
MPCIDGMWDARARSLMHPGYRLILRWCHHLDFEDVLRIDRASIAAAATDSSRFIASWRIVFGDQQLPRIIVPFGLVNVTQRYVVERDRESAVTTPPESLVFAEILGEVVTRASVCDAIRRAVILLRLA